MNLGIWDFVAAPVIGALIGWSTNVIAIKMLFWPKKPVKILGFEFVGLLPKRKKDLAMSVGQTIDQDLLPMDEVMGILKENKYQDHLVGSIVSHVGDRVHQVLPRILPENVKQVIEDYVREIVAKESHRMIEHVTVDMVDKFQEEVNFGVMVQDKIESLDLDQLEGLITRLAHEELRHIELLGAVLGFAIGLLQTFFLFWRVRAMGA